MSILFVLYQLLWTCLLLKCNLLIVDTDSTTQTPTVHLNQFHYCNASKRFFVLQFYFDHYFCGCKVLRGKGKSRFFLLKLCSSKVVKTVKEIFLNAYIFSHLPVRFLLSIRPSNSKLFVLILKNKKVDYLMHSTYLGWMYLV